MGKKVVIIGGVAAGAKTAARLRRRDPKVEITVLEQGEYLSYGACGLPYYVSDVVKDDESLMNTPTGVVRNAQFFKNVKGFDAIIHVRAEEIDAAQKVVRAINVETGTLEDFHYDKLVIATGGSPVVPPFEGADLANIFRLSTIEDGRAIKNYINTGNAKNAVIVGAGLIGLEMVEAFKERGVTVSVVELLDWVAPALLDEDMGLLVSQYLTSEGVGIHTSEKVLRFEGDGAGNVQKVITNKNELPADMVLLSIGLRPNVGLAQKAGLDISETGAILVNEFCQTSDPDIYAGGDCVDNNHGITGERAYTPLGSAANKHGRIIADHIVGKATTPFPGVFGTAICKVLKYTIARTGLSEREAVTLGYRAQTIICPGPDKPHFYPTVDMVIIKLVADSDTGKILGAQLIGPGDVAKRADVVATGLAFGATAARLSTVDLAYSPPFSSALDAIITAANVMLNKLEGLAKSLSPLAVKEKVDRGDDFVFLDVRSPQEYEQVRIENPAVMLIPLGKLRQEWTKIPRDKEVIAFCAASLRGYEAQLILEANGFTNVKFMDGGLAAWPFEKVVAES